MPKQPYLYAIPAYLSIFLWMVAYIHIGHAQELSYHAQSHYLTMQKGLSNPHMTTMLQDQKGFVWIGTGYGLNRYDGYQIKSYTKERNGLYSNNISALAEDINGWLWVCYPKNFATHEGLIGIDLLHTSSKKLIKLHDYFDQFPIKLKDITYICNNEDKSIWIASKNKELWEYDGQHFKKILSTSDILLKAIKTQKGNGWALLKTKSGERKLIYFTSRNQILETLSSKDSAQILQGELRNIQKGIGEAIFFYTWDTEKKQQYIYNQTPNAPPSAFLPQLRKNFIKLHPFPNQNMAWAWKERESDSIYIYNLEGKFLLSIDLNMSMQSPYKNIYETQQGEFWTNIPAKNGIAIVHIHPTKFKKLWAAPSHDQSSLQHIRGIHQTDSFIYAAGTIFKHKNIQQQHSTYVDRAQKIHSSLAIWKDKNMRHQLWITVERPVLIKRDFVSKTNQTYTYASDNSPPKLHWSIYRDKKENILWLGSDKGLSFLDEKAGVLRQYPLHFQAKTIETGPIYHFHENDQGLWLATGSGLYLFKPKEGIVRHLHSNAKDKAEWLPHDIIAHIYEDEEGLFWLASKGGGLIRWSPATNQSQQFTTAHGLSHNVIYAIYKGKDNQFWISSNYGIMSFNPKTYLTQTYLLQDGISHEEFNTGAHFQASDKTIYFGGLNGITVFNPNDFKPNDLPKAPLRITYYGKYNDQKEQFEDLTLNFLEVRKIEVFPNEKSFALHFSLMDFRNPSSTKYAYKIQGFEKSWHYVSNNELKINHLPFGNYKLIIKAQGPNGIWTTPLTIPVHILKPFYLKWWFAVIFLCILTGIIWLFIRFRIHQLKKREIQLETEVSKRTQQIEKDRQIIQRQAEDLKNLDKVKTRFFANISHELRTPLTLIMGPLSHIIDHPEILHLPETLQRLETMQRNGENLLQLIEEILDISKLEASKLELQEQSIDFYPYIRRLFSAFSSQASYLQIQYELKYLTDPNLVILLDIKKVEKIINNLIANALKFTPSGGTIICKIMDWGESLQILIKDSGTGIHPKDLPHIFDRFYQSKQPNAPIEGGTGLGLALSQELARLMGGNIIVESTFGRGSIFKLNLPKKMTDNPPVSFVGAPTPILKAPPVEITKEETIPNRFKLLIVEDHKDMRQFIQNLFSNLYETCTKEHGKAALEYLKNSITLPDLIISDVMMPEMDGFEFLKHLKNHSEWQKIPVIMLTARADQEDKLNALTIGSDDYILKPFSSKEILVRVKNLLQHYNNRKTEEKTAPQKTISKQKHPIGKEPPVISYDDQQWIKQVEHIVENTITDTTLNVTYMVQQMHISDRQFRRRLKKITGLSPVKYLRELRLQKARFFLENRKFKTLQEVCNAVGITDKWYFTKQYANRFGKSPDAYSEMH